MILRGMIIEIITGGTEPTSKDIFFSVNKKYDLKLNSLSISRENWSMEMLS
tara:strand:- start:176 stop:328 length:153 start_codon:yes stop_codon:yes gene_type:complete